MQVRLIAYVLEIKAYENFTGNDTRKIKKGVGPVRADFGLKFQIHLTKDFGHFLTDLVIKNAPIQAQI